jgi:hypothetical protein
LQGKEIIPKNQLYPVATAARVANTAKTDSTSGIILYPNPATGSFWLKFNAKQARIIIYDVSGREVMPARIIQSGSPVNIADLKAGLYLIYIDINGVRITKHLIKG